MTEKIVIHTTISLNSLKYYQYVIASYQGLSSGTIEIVHFAYCLDRYSYHKLRFNRKVAKRIFCGYGKGSEGHAQAINFALKNPTEKAINIISDTDIVIVRRNWDLLISKILNSQSDLCSVLGTQLESIGGFSTGDTKYQQYKKKPSTTWFAMSPHYDFTDLEVTPKKNEFDQINNIKLEKLYNLPNGYFLVKDTGWQIPKFLETKNYPYKILEIIKPSDESSVVLKKLNDYHDEFHFSGEPFLVHQRGSMKHKFRVDKLSSGFYEATDLYLKNPTWSIKPTYFDFFTGTIRLYYRAIKKIIRSKILGWNKNV